MTLPSLTGSGELRALLRDRRPAWNGAGYPPEVRAQVAAWAQPLREAGYDLSVLADTLGVSRNALRSWCARWPRLEEKAPTAALLPVRVASPADEAEVPRPVLVTPRGDRVENLDDDLLLRLLRELA